uniref:Uncharacterized protein n=1 Tax=Tanacetum cinerariifolium TaxID=118510 RepID=A0A699GMP2_TANCI|nr:hypothetical protein [Tanacetum cinerariifolium]
MQNRGATNSVSLMHGSTSNPMQSGGDNCVEVDGQSSHYEHGRINLNDETISTQDTQDTNCVEVDGQSSHFDKSGSGVGVVLGLFDAAGPGGTGVGSQGSSYTRWTKRIVQTERISPQKRTPTQPASQPSTSSQVPMSETRNANEREIGDGIPTQSSAAGGASEWDYVRVVVGTDDKDFDNELMIPTPWFDESKNEKGLKDKDTKVMKDKVSQEHVCEEDVLLNNNIGKQSGDLVEMPSKAVEQEIDDHVSNEIDGAKCE